MISIDFESHMVSAACMHIQLFSWAFKSLLTSAVISFAVTVHVVSGLSFLQLVVVDVIRFDVVLCFGVVDHQYQRLFKQFSLVIYF